MIWLKSDCPGVLGLAFSEAPTQASWSSSWHKQWKRSNKNYGRVKVVGWTKGKKRLQQVEERREGGETFLKDEIERECAPLSRCQRGADGTATISPCPPRSSSSRKERVAPLPSLFPHLFNHKANWQLFLSNLFYQIISCGTSIAVRSPTLLLAVYTIYRMFHQSRRSSNPLVGARQPSPYNVHALESGLPSSRCSPQCSTT
jgi:hypothetical protein